jgi:hypothetical protein
LVSDLLGDQSRQETVPGALVRERPAAVKQT